MGLAEFWNNYAIAYLPDYAAFISGLAMRWGLALRSVLDLACGSGVLTKWVAGMAEEVVGLDISEPMLAVARRRLTEIPAVKFMFWSRDPGSSALTRKPGGSPDLWRTAKLMEAATRTGFQVQLRRKQALAPSRRREATPDGSPAKIRAGCHMG
jgi:SAM-dependent methyltransferase